MRYTQKQITIIKASLSMSSGKARFVNDQFLVMSGT